MTRKTCLGAALAAAVFLAGCGSGAQRDAAPPRLHRQLATALAERSAGVAQALDAGDTCKALRLAQDLRLQTIAAINAGRVPAPLQEPLQDRVNDLAERIQCLPPPPADEHGKGKDEGNGKKKKHGKGHD